MGVRIRDGKLLYHLTAFENLPSIAEHGLLSRNDLRAHGLLFEDVADPDILRDRGDLDRYVPFHFFPRNPFDYAVLHRNPGKPMTEANILRAADALVRHNFCRKTLLGYEVPTE